MQEENDIYRAVFRESPAPILIIDAETGNVLDANRSFFEFLNRSAHEIIGVHYNDLSTGGEFNHLLSKAGKATTKDEITLKSASGPKAVQAEVVKFAFAGHTAYQIILSRGLDDKQAKSSTRIQPVAINSYIVKRLQVFCSGFVMSAALNDLLDGQTVDISYFDYPDQLETGVEVLANADFLVFAVHQITDEETAEIIKICRLQRNLPILVMCLSASNRDVIKLVKEGVRGIISDESEFHLLTAAINAIMKDELWCPRSVMLQVFENFRRLPAEWEEGSPLTERETDVLKLIVDGFKNREIADKLEISYSTVINHTNNIYRKLDVNNRAGAIRAALDYSLI